MTNYFNIDCTSDVITGDEIEFVEAVFGGSYRKPKFLGERTIRARVTKDSYGSDKQQHTFSLEVLDSEGYRALTAGDKIRRKGRNIYRSGTMRKPWNDEDQRRSAQHEKHHRGDVARRARDERRWGCEGFY